ncbi:MAG: SbcC/MukB-like Walker B domain-containing protein [Methylococcaceae bacterium]
MKILNIYFKNINSLEGESRIHFDQAPIADGGVFAITGPNGSGKSSVLDVITLGLYGETFRFDRPADHVMTKSTTESFAQVEFLLGDDKFRSCWHVKRKNGDSEGELLAPEMTLTQLNGSEQALEGGIQKVRAKMVELTGMDFHKFSKSMVLAQGDFAAFLNALDSERMDILEKISGVDIYQEYQQQAEEKNTQAQTRLQQLGQDLSAIPVLDDATLEASEHDLADYKVQQTEFKNEHDNIQQQLAQVQKTRDLENQFQNFSKKLEQEQGEQQENQQVLEKIDSLQNVLGLEEELTAVDNKAEETQQSKKTLDSYYSELKILQNQLKSSGFDEAAAVSDKTVAQQKNSIDQLKLESTELKAVLPKENTFLQTLNQKIDEKKSILSTTETWLQEHVNEKSLLENFPETEKLKMLRAELSESDDKQQAHTKWSKNTTEKLNKNKASIKTLNQKNVDLKVQLEENEKSILTMADGNSLQDLQEMEAEQQQRVENFRELYDLANVNAKLGKKGFFGLSIFNKQAGVEEKQLKDEADTLQLEIGRERNIVKTLEAAIVNEQLLKKMEADRIHLVDGKACPLCGALEHPYSKHAPAVSVSKQVLVEQQKKVKALVSGADSLAKQIIAAQKQAVKDDQKESRLEVVCSQWNSLANRLNTASVDLDIDNLSLMKDLMKSEKQELVNVTNLLKKYAKRESLIAQAKVAIETNEHVLQRVETETEALDAEWNNRPQESVEPDQVYKKSQAEEQVLEQKIVGQLDALGEKMPAKGKENVLIERLNARKQEYQAQVMRQQTLVEEIQALDVKITASSTKVNEINRNIQQCSEKMQQQEGAGLHLSLIEKQKMIAEKEQQVSQQQDEVTALKQKLTEQGDLNLLRDNVTLVQKQPELQQKQQELSQSISNIKNSLEKAQSQLDAEQSNEPNINTEEQLLLQQKSIKEKLEITKQEIVTLQNKLNKQNDLKEKYSEVSAKLESQKTLAKASETDIRAIVDNNGIQFKQKVQQIMIDKLLSQTNQILEKLSGRYYVRKKDSEHGLGLEIEDTKQNNVRRLPKTLSGGESFIVSLALALALAEMANNGHAVDSLFLDEGFGNLDAESLYLAMTTLESLKTHGKVVGIISHVEGVSKRIKTQIEMIKKPNGFSALKMVS